MDPLQRLARLQALAATLAGTVDPADVASAAVHHARAALGADGTAIITVGPGDYLRILRSEGYTAAALAGAERLRVSDTHAISEALGSGRPVFGLTAKVVRLPHERALAQEAGAATLAVIPLRAGDRVLGALMVSFRTERSIGAEERVFLESLALQSAQALARAEMTAALSENARSMALRADVSAALLAERGIDERLSRCMSALAIRLDGVLARLWILDEPAQVLRLRASAGVEGRIDGPGSLIAVGELAIGRIAKERTALLSNDALREIEFADLDWAARENVRSFAGHPLVAEGRLLGVVALVSRRAFAAGDVEALSEIAQMIAQAILRHEARAELQESRDHLALILRTIAEGVTAQDETARLVFANDAAARQMGYATVPELLASTVEERLARMRMRFADGTPLTVERSTVTTAMRSGKPSQAEILIRDPASGRDRRVLASSTPTGRRVGRPTLAITVLHDVTEARREEAAWRLLAEAPEALSASLDPDATLQAVAQFCATRLVDWATVELFAVDGQQGRIATAHRLPQKAALVGDLTSRARLQPPSGRTALVTRLAVGARTLGELALGTDPERELEAGELRLAEEVARRASLALENARLYAAAQEAARAREIFLSVAAHELRTPLTSVLLLIQALERRAQRSGETMPATEVLRLGGRVSAGVLRLSKLVDRLLDVSRITSGGFHLQLEDADLRELAREAITRLEEGSAAKTIELRADHPLLGRWDRLRLDEVLTNLLSNAVKYGAGRPVVLEAFIDGSEVVLRVIDQGIGIAARDQVRIFERFERLVAVRHHTSGLGLGLWIVRQICEAMGGSVAVESREGEGATFTVRLPRT